MANELEMRKPMQARHSIKMPFFVIFRFFLSNVSPNTPVTEAANNEMFNKIEAIKVNLNMTPYLSYCSLVDWLTGAEPRQRCRSIRLAGDLPGGMDHFFAGAGSARSSLVSFPTFCTLCAFS